MARGYCRVGTITGIHGTRGELRLEVAGGATDPLRPGMEVALVPPTLEDRRYRTVRGVRSTGAGDLLTLEGVGDRGAASRCLDRAVLARRGDLPEDWGRSGHGEYVGLAVEDVNHGTLGSVAAVEEGPLQALLVVQGPFGEVLVPAVAPILREVVDGTIRVACPPGLIELSSKGEG